MPADKPKFENAPGNQVRSRKDGTWVCFWIARRDLIKEGYRPPLVRLWQGLEPNDADRAYISDSCGLLQAEMLGWRHRHGIPLEGAYDGTLAALVIAYRSDKDSSYHKLRYDTRRN